jgi:hypothetical protein
VFAANGITASVTVTGVKSADQVRITLTLNGSAAQIDEHQHEGADHPTELEGRVTATARGGPRRRSRLALRCRCSSTSGPQGSAMAQRR